MSSETNKNNDFNIFVGGMTGAFKGIKVDSNGAIVKNLQNIETLKPENEISILAWSDKQENDILIGTVDQVVKVYDIEFKAYSSSLETKFGSGALVGLTRYNGAVMTCSESGHVKIWKFKKNEELEFPTGGKVSKMKKYDGAEGIIATGGQQNDLKVWDLNTKTKVFAAKNVKKDMLELEVPVWVSDLVFLPDCEYKIAVCSKHGQLRLYDTRAQRRPVLEKAFENQALNTLSLCCNENQVVTGSATGHILLSDLRTNGRIVHTYKGAVGSIRQVTTHPSLPYVASVGLDRHMRVHHLETKKLVHQEYLKVRLNCVLMKHTFGQEDDKKEIDQEENVLCVNLENDEEFDDLFLNMETVGEEAHEPVKKKQKKNK